MRRPGPQKWVLKFAVYREVRRRLKRLNTIRKVVRKPRDLYEYSCGLMDGLMYRWTIEYGDAEFRVGVEKPQAVVQEEFKKARTWLLGVIRMQEKVYSRSHMVRLLREGVESEARRGLGDDPGKVEAGAGSSRDLQMLYMTLTQPDEDDPEDVNEWDYEDHLDVAFLIAMHCDYARKYADVLEKLYESTGRRRSKSLSPTQSIMRRIIQKTQSAKVDGFACAIPLAAIKLMPLTDQACGICQNGYLDVQSFSTEDLIADYPVRIKYCGHVFGKKCLETWMETPLMDAAKYPHHTCPVCRVKIEGRQVPRAPRELIKHYREEDAIETVMREADNELEEEDCRDGILRCISEEVALVELSKEVEGPRIAGKLRSEKLRQCSEVLGKGLEEIKEERRMWGFVGEKKETMWRKIGEEWRMYGSSEAK